MKYIFFYLIKVNSTTIQTVTITAIYQLIYKFFKTLTVLIQLLPRHVNSCPQMLPFDHELCGLLSVKDDCDHRSTGEHNTAVHWRYPFDCLFDHNHFNTVSIPPEIKVNKKISSFLWSFDGEQLSLYFPLIARKESWSLKIYSMNNIVVAIYILNFSF